MDALLLAMITPRGPILQVVKSFGDDLVKNPRLQLDSPESGPIVLESLVIIGDKTN